MPCKCLAEHLAFGNALCFWAVSALGLFLAKVL